jgi:hypothetical protein
VVIYREDYFIIYTRRKFVAFVAMLILHTAKPWDSWVVSVLSPFLFRTTPKFRGVIIPSMPFYSNATCTHMGGIPVTSMLFPFRSLSWFYLAGEIGSLLEPPTMTYTGTKPTTSGTSIACKNILALGVGSYHPKGDSEPIRPSSHDLNCGLSAGKCCKEGRSLP